MIDSTVCKWLDERGLLTALFVSGWMRVDY